MDSPPAVTLFALHSQKDSYLCGTSEGFLAGALPTGTSPKSYGWEITGIVCGRIISSLHRAALHHHSVLLATNSAIKPGIPGGVSGGQLIDDSVRPKTREITYHVEYH